MSSKFISLIQFPINPSPLSLLLYLFPHFPSLSSCIMLSAILLTLNLTPPKSLPKKLGLQQLPPASGEVLNPCQRPTSSSIAASEITSFTLWVYLNQPFMADGFKNMLEVSILNTRNTNKQMRLHFPSSVPSPPSIPSSSFSPASSQSSFHS